MQKEMEESIKLRVPLVVNIYKGKSWGKMTIVRGPKVDIKK